MSEDFNIQAQTRNTLGKGASRRLRRLNNLVPAIVYGGEKPPENLAVAHHQILRALENEAFYSHILTIDIDGRKEKVLLKALQRHPVKPKILHLDFQRVSGNEVIHRHVPLHFLNEENCAGVKQGGVVTHQLKDVEIKCAVRQLPEYIEVDLTQLQLDDIWHLSQLTLPKGVEILALTHGAEYDSPVVSVHLPRAATEAAAESVVGAAPATPAESE